MHETASETLLRAAVRIFGECGLAGASTRKIAAAAGVPMSLITYHFGGKEGLYLATAEYIARQIAQHHAGEIAALATPPARDAQDAATRLTAILDRFARMMLGPQSQDWARFIVREQQQPTAAFARIYDGVIAPMLEQILALIAQARPDLGERDRRALLTLIYGQVVFLRVGRASICRIFDPPAPTIDEALGATLRAGLAASLRALLKEYRP